jgi:WD40 repeat protein
MDQCPSATALRRFLAEQLPDAESGHVEAHVEACARCQQSLEELTGANRVHAAGAETLTTNQPDATFLRRVQADLHQLTAATLGDRALVAPPPEAKPPVVADHVILGVLGRGGMGVVYKAWQTKFKRLVALKMIGGSGSAGVSELVRFRVEAEAVARLQHPNIVQAFETGETDGRPFLVLEFVDGGSLAEQLRGPVPARQSAALLETLARATSYAHQRGIIHRDLKPGNILMAGANGPSADAAGGPAAGACPHGEPKIADFGLAKLIVGGADGSRWGAVLGTPAYMAPEQAAGKTKDISTAVDVYSLGAILYELLTARLPFEGRSAAETLQKLATESPVPPRRLQRGVPRDLEMICLRCLEKDPRRRYESAADLAEDLRRFQAGKAVKARPVHPAERLWKWARREPATAALILVAAVSAAGLLAGTLWYQRRLEQSLADTSVARDLAETARDEAREARRDADLKRSEAEEQRDEASRNLYLASIPLAQRAWQAAHVERVRDLLGGVRPRSAGQKDLRNFEWHYLQGLGRTGLRTWPGHAGGVTTVAFSPDGRRLASAGADGTVRVRDLASGVDVYPPLKDHGRLVTCVAFSPDGSLLASAGADKRVVLWDAATGKWRRVLEGHTGRVYHVAFSPDGRRLASASKDKSIRVWDTGSGREEMRPLLGHSEQVTAVAFSPVENRLASAGADHQVRLWDLSSKDLPAKLEGHTAWVYSVSFGPDGRELASCSSDRTLRVWHVSSGREPLMLPGHSSQVRSATFSPDGRRLASASFDGTVRVWDASSGDPLFCYRGHAGHVNCVAFHPDGRLLASAGADGTVKIWDGTRHQEFLAAEDHTVGPVNSVVFSPDGKHLVSGAADQSIRVWDVAAGRPLLPFAGHTGPVHGLAFSADGKLLVSGADKTVCLWDAPGRKPLHVLKGHTRRVAGVAISPDDTAVASAGYDGKVKVWRRSDGEQLLDLTAHAGRALGVAFSPDGKQLATCGEDHLVQLWDTRTGSRLRSLEGHTGWVYCVAFSPDGATLASSDADGSVKTWSVATGAELLRLEGHTGRVNSVVFNKAGDRLASAGTFDRTVRVWDLTRGQELLSLDAHGPAHGVAFSPDGTLLASAAAGVLIWDATPEAGSGPAP